MIDLPTAIRAKSGILCNLDGPDRFKTVADAYPALVEMVRIGDTLEPTRNPPSFSLEDAERWWSEWSAEEQARKQAAKMRAAKEAEALAEIERLAARVAALEAKA